MALIFINYRRRDEAYAAALLDELLSRHFGEGAIFRASRSITAGADYELSILRAVDVCRVMIVLVGPNWSTAIAEASAAVRADWVRREIVEAFKREVPIIPILLSSVPRLTEEDVPLEISWITRSQYLRFDYRNFRQDAAQIAHELRRVVPDLPKRPRLPLALFGGGRRRGGNR